MAGKTGYTGVSNGDAPDFGPDITDVYEHFDPLIGESAADASALPSSGNWAHREVMALDTKIVYRHDGSAWKAWDSPWISYSPTLTGVAIGTGGSALSTWVYKYVAGDVRIKGGLILGTSGASVSGIPTISLPVNRVALLHAYEATLGAATLFDASATTPYLVAVGTDNTNVDRVRFFPHNSGAVATAVSSTVPFTWTSGDAISADFSYRPA